MNKHETMFEALESVVEELREIESTERDEEGRPDRIFTIRRRLQKAQDDYIKQGDRVLITKEFGIKCVECNQPELTEDAYYLHLRQQHQYEDEDAASEANNPRHDYDLGISELRKYLAEFTDALLEETAHA
jgi:hypothetical protein